MTKTSSTIIVWRTDSELYAIGRTIRSRGDHFSNLSEINQKAEIALRAAMPNGKTLRASSLYTWRDEEWARHSWPLSKHKYLYKLEVSPSDISHIGDVNYYTDIGQALRDGKTVDNAVHAYASGSEFTPPEHHRPRVEILVTKAKVLVRY